MDARDVWCAALLASVLAAVFLTMPSARAQRRPLLESYWTPEARLWLARAQVSEADWTAHRDHDAIAWVLYRRWMIHVERRLSRGQRPHPFEWMVRQYCAGLGDEPPRRPRQRWVRELSESGERPEHWPDDAEWERYAPYWDGILARVDMWEAGLIADPTDGRAIHWGSPEDTPPIGYRRLRNLRTRNVFYGWR